MLSMQRESSERVGESGRGRAETIAHVVSSAITLTTVVQSDLGESLQVFLCVLLRPVENADVSFRDCRVVSEEKTWRRERLAHDENVLLMSHASLPSYR